MTPLQIRRNDRILIIAPHPDDECIGAGGVICAAPQQCTVWVLTDGRVGQNDMSKEDTIKTRQNEMIKAMEYAGVKAYKFWGIEDGNLMSHINVLKKADFTPFTKIFVTGIKDGHADHTAAFLSVKEALETGKIEVECFLYEVHTPLLNPTHYLDITNWMEKKKAMIALYRSQLSTQRYDEGAQALAVFRGHQNRMSGRCLEVYEQYMPGEAEEKAYDGLELQTKYQKQVMFYRILTKWIQSLLEHKGASRWIRENGYENVVIYGYAEIGQLLFEELNRADIRVLYVMDKNRSLHGNGKIELCYPEPGMKTGDVIIVTAPMYFENIKQELKQMGYDNIVSISDIFD